MGSAPVFRPLVRLLRAFYGNGRKMPLACAAGVVYGAAQQQMKASAIAGAASGYPCVFRHRAATSGTIQSAANMVFRKG